MEDRKKNVHIKNCECFFWFHRNPNRCPSDRREFFPLERWRYWVKIIIKYFKAVVFGSRDKINVIKRYGPLMLHFRRTFWDSQVIYRHFIQNHLILHKAILCTKHRKKTQHRKYVVALRKQLRLWFAAGTQ